MKAVRETSIAVYRDDIVPSLGRREQIVLDALKDWPGEPPTAYELFQALKAQGLAMDLNAIRPRCTGLLAKGAIVVREKRACRVTGKLAMTWQVAPRSTLFDLT